VVNTVVISNAAPSYASAGQTLISTSTLGLPNNADTEIAVRKHLAALYGISTDGWTSVTNYHIKHALPAMLPPHQVKQPAKISEGLYVAGDYRAVSSINGAFASGRRAAEALIIDGL
ncbi:MAG: FAD-dependent oxidoreductase, partial [Actinomycetales bacterium]|nr:FAD-dependent oxidoreductase [Actinomycetales bacterium]